MSRHNGRTRTIVRHHQDICRQCGDFISHRDILTVPIGTPDSAIDLERRPRYKICFHCAAANYLADLAIKQKATKALQ